MIEIIFICCSAYAWSLNPPKPCIHLSPTFSGRVACYCTWRRACWPCYAWCTFCTSSLAWLDRGGPGRRSVLAFHGKGSCSQCLLFVNMAMKITTGSLRCWRDKMALESNVASGWPLTPSFPLLARVGAALYWLACDDGVCTRLAKVINTNTMKLGVPTDCVVLLEGRVLRGVASSKVESVLCCLRRRQRGHWQEVWCGCFYALANILYGFCMCVTVMGSWN